MFQTANIDDAPWLRASKASRKLAPFHRPNSELRARSIARPIGRAWIETQPLWALWTHRPCIAQPIGRAWIET
jgi:hypothetical protein